MQLIVTFLHEVEASYWLENPSESYTNIEISYSHFSMFPNFQLSTKTSFIAQKKDSNTRFQEIFCILKLGKSL